MKMAIIKKITTSFLRNVDDNGDMVSISLIFSMANGYRKFISVI